jgi:hypothetical protein
MRPHFDFHTIQIEVPKLTEKSFDLPKPVEKPFDLPKPVDKPFNLPMPVEGPPGPTADASPLPPKTPDSEEKKFINRPDYQSADVKGRIVRSFDNGPPYQGRSSGRRVLPQPEVGPGRALKALQGGVPGFFPRMFIDGETPQTQPSPALKSGAFLRVA